MFRMADSLTLLALVFIAPAAVFAADRPQPGAQNAEKQSIRVELLAISSAPIEDHGWWDADGKKLTMDAELEDWKPAAAPKDLERDQIARYLRVKAIVPAGASVNLAVPGQKYALHMPVKFDDRSWDDLKKEAQERVQPFDIHDFETAEYALSCLFVCDFHEHQIDAEVHVTQGEWEAVAKRAPTEEDENWVVFKFDNLFDPQGRPIDHVNPKADFRIEAEDSNGERHQPAVNAKTSNTDGVIESVQATFKLPDTTIVAYHLLTRPQMELRINSIPLYPNDIPATQQIRNRGGVFVGDRDLIIGVEKNTNPADLDWMNCNDDDVALLSDCPSLRRVYIASDAITDRAAELLADTQQLRHIRLTGNQLTEASLRHLSRCQAEIIELTGRGLKHIPNEIFSQLAKSETRRDLRLWDTALTDDNLQALSSLTSLRVLCADGHQLTPAGLKQLASMPFLQEIRLPGANWTDETIALLQPLKSLRRIDLADSAITNAGLAELANITSLEWIDLQGTDITNQGVAALAALNDLQRLELRGTRCNRGSWNTLSEPFPDIRMRIPPAPGRDVEMAVTVHDHEGQPVPNADVWLFTSDHFYARRNRNGKPFPAPPQLGKSKTDEQGQAVIAFNNEKKMGFYGLWAIAPDGRPVLDTFSSYGNAPRIEKRLQFNDGQVTIRVVNPDGEPIPGVLVVPFEIPHELPRPLFDSVGKTSDNEGRVTFPGLNKKAIEDIYLRSERHGEQSTGQLGISPDGSDISVQLSPTGTLGGQFHGAGKAEYKHLRGTIYVESYGSPNSHADVKARYSWAPLEVDANGNFQVEHLTAGYARFTDETTEGSFRIQWAPTKILPQELTLVESDLERVVPIVGTVRLYDNWQLAEQLPVRLQSGGRRGNRTWNRGIETDHRGRFTNRVLPGELEVDVTQFYHEKFTSIDNWQWRNGHFGGAHLVQSSDKNREHAWYLEPVDLARAVKKSGTLVDRNGEPLNQSVYGFPAEPTEELSITNCTGSSTRKAGRFEMFYPETHPPVIFRGSNREYFYTIKQTDPLILVDETKPGE